MKWIGSRRAKQFLGRLRNSVTTHTIMSHSDDLHSTLTSQVFSRRRFFRTSALGLAAPIAGVALAGCSAGEAGSDAAHAVAVDSNASGGTVAAHVPAPQTAR